MRYQDGTAELYDMQKDPNEFHNVADQAEKSDVRNLLNEQLNARLQEMGI